MVLIKGASVLLLLALSFFISSYFFYFVLHLCLFLLLLLSEKLTATKATETLTDFDCDSENNVEDNYHKGGNGVGRNFMDSDGEDTSAVN